jgi:hypothetical protein
MPYLESSTVFEYLQETSTCFCYWLDTQPLFFATRTLVTIRNIQRHGSNGLRHCLGDERSSRRWIFDWAEPVL